jgi:hypothetical protein
MQDDSRPTLTLWAQDSAATDTLQQSLGEYGYAVDVRLSGSPEPVLQRGTWFYSGRENIARFFFAVQAERRS